MKRSFFTILPATVRYHETLSASAKLIYAEIVASMDENGICRASNEEFAKLFKTSERSVTRWVADLTEAGFVFTACLNTAGGGLRLLSTDKMLLMACHGLGEVEPVAKNGDRSDIYNKAAVETSASPIRVENGPEKPGDNSGELFTAGSTKAEKCEPGEVLALYHSLCPMLPRVRVLNGPRKSAIKARFKESDGKFSIFTELFTKAAASKFLTGRAGGDRPFVADFDFLTSPGGFAKTLDGKYDDKAGPARRVSGGEDITPALT